MIRTAAALATMIAGISAQALPEGFDTSCQPPFVTLYLLGGACRDSLMDANCTTGQTLFDVLDPATFCNDQTAPLPPANVALPCSTFLPSTFDDLDDMGCCTLDTLYLVNEGSSCDDTEQLSFTGLADTIEYFCENVETTPTGGEPTTFYCLTDAQTYVAETGVAVQSAFNAQLSGDPATAAAIFNAGVDCNYVAGASCCFASLLNYAEGCGGESKAAQAVQLSNWISVVGGFCPGFQSVPVDFSSICTGLNADLSNCLADSDSNCKDSASSIVTSTLAALFAAVAGLALFKF